MSTLINLYRRNSLPHSPSWPLLSPSQVLSYLLCPITTLSAGIGEHGGLMTWFLFWSWNKHGLLIAVFRLEIYLTKQFHPKCSSLLHILLPTSTMWNNYSQTSLQVTVPKLADIFLVYIVYFLNFVTQSSVPCNGGSLEGFVTMSSCGKTTHLIWFLLPVCFWNNGQGHKPQKNRWTVLGLFKEKKNQTLPVIQEPINEHTF